MIFPKLPSGINKISIREKVTNGFVWEGIHINNQHSGNGHRPSEGGLGSIARNNRTNSEREFEMTGSGSGFAISRNGIIATCYHVISDARRIRIRGINGDFNKTYSAQVYLTDKKNDIALLKIDDTSFRSLPTIPYFVSEKTVSVGSPIYVLGYPLRALMGDEIKLTNGIVSSMSGFQGDITSYQVSAPVQPGNSGGPLFDENGVIVGIVNARLAVENASYAVKSPYITVLTGNGQNKVTELAGKTLAEQVQLIKQFVYIIEV